MALSDEDKAEITKLVRAELYNAALEIFEELDKTETDAKAREHARIIGQSIIDIVSKNYSDSFGSAL